MFDPLKGSILDDERGRLYTAIVNKGSAARFAFAAAMFGEFSEALFWLQLPRALNHLMNKLLNKSTEKPLFPASVQELGDTSMLGSITSKGRTENRPALVSDIYKWFLTLYVY